MTIPTRSFRNISGRDTSGHETTADPAGTHPAINSKQISQEGILLECFKERKVHHMDQMDQSKDKNLDKEKKFDDSMAQKADLNIGLNADLNTDQDNKYGKTGCAMEELLETVAKLRAPDGCPWDRVQTHESLKAACVEEAAEVVSAINILSETGRAQALKEELGDLLLQVVMHAQIAEEEGLFTMEDVIQGVNEKMIRRHPHVFGEKSLQYLPPDYVSLLTRPSEARTEGLASDCVHIGDIAERDAESLSEPHRDFDGLLIDWKLIKSFEKKGREWEEDYLFRAFDEAEDLISVARQRKLERRRP